MMNNSRMNDLHKLTALCDELRWFFVAALAGKIHEATGRAADIAIGSQQTPVSVGLSEGYSVHDIAYFYVALELGNRWVEEILDNLNEQFRIRLESAFDKFCTDVKFEKQYAVQMMRQEVNSGEVPA